MGSHKEKNVHGEKNSIQFETRVRCHRVTWKRAFPHQFAVEKKRKLFDIVLPTNYQTPERYKERKIVSFKYFD